MRRSPASRPPLTKARALRGLGLAACLFCAIAATVGAAPIRAPEMAVRRYNLTGGDAADTLREFARVSELQLLFPERIVRGLRLPPLYGSYSPRDALDRLLADTGLEAVSDPGTGTYAVRRSRRATAPPPPAPPALVTKPAAAPPPLEMEPVRIEQRREFGTSTQSILRADRMAALYHHVATRSEIEQSGATNMAEFVTTLPGYSGEGAEALQTTADLTFAGGANVYAGSYLKLRGWDAQHTTVLLNGRRLPLSPESRGPDLSRIPLAAVERVELMPFAGSAIYGEGAAGGAMNIVLRKDLEGGSFTLQFGESTRGGGRESSFTWLEGLASADRRTRATIIGDYQRRSLLRLGDRDFLARAVERLPAAQLLARAGSLGIDLHAQLGAGLTGYPSVFVVAAPTSDLGIPGRPGAQFAVVPPGTHAANLLPADTRIGTDPTALASRRQDRLALRRPTETFNLNVQLEHTVVPEAFELYGELSFARADERFTAPDTIEPLSLGATDPRNPFRNDSTSRIFNRAVRLYFDPVDLPDTSFRQTRDSVRAVLGARGTLAQNWRWVLDGYADHSRSRAHAHSYGASLNDVTRAWTPSAAPLLLLFYDPLADHRLAPLDPETRERFLARDARFDYRSRMAGADLRLGGTAVVLPAGALRVAFGAEYAWHDLRTSQKVDASEELYSLLGYLNADAGAAGRFASLTALRTSADRGARLGGVAEAVVPILHGRKQHVPLQSVELNVASRTAQTNQAHLAWGNLAALKVAPSTSWAIRGTISQGYVMPDNALLQRPAAEENVTLSLRDPRRGGTPQAYPINVREGGSAALRPETSRARVLGLLFTPTAVPRLFVSVDAWSIAMKNRQRMPTVQEMVEHEDYFPGKIERGVPQTWEALLGWSGPVTRADLRPVPITRLSAEGIDVAFRYRLPPLPAGTFALHGQLEIVSRYDEQFLPVTSAVNKIDVVADASSGGLMEAAVVSPRARATLAWQRGRWSASLSAAYTPRYQTDTTTPTPTLPGASGLDGDYIGSSIRWDLQASHTLAPGRAAGWLRWLADSTWTLGVRNVFDKAPPYRSDGRSFYSRFDDPLMRWLYVRVQWRR